MHTQYHGDGKYSIKFTSPKEEAEFLAPFQALAKCTHKWHQDYIQPYMVGKGTPANPAPGQARSVKENLLIGDQPVPGQFRCSRCQAIGKYQELSADKSYEPVITRIR